MLQLFLPSSTIFFNFVFMLGPVCSSLSIVTERIKQFSAEHSLCPTQLCESSFSVYRQANTAISIIILFVRSGVILSTPHPEIDIQSHLDFLNCSHIKSFIIILFVRSGVARPAPVSEISSLIWVLQALLTFTLLQGSILIYLLKSELLNCEYLDQALIFILGLTHSFTMYGGGQYYALNV